MLRSKSNEVGVRLAMAVAVLLGSVWMAFRPALMRFASAVCCRERAPLTLLTSTAPRAPGAVSPSLCSCCLQPEQCISTSVFRMIL